MLYIWQQESWQQLQRQHRHKRLPHALLFVGPAGNGKLHFARALARSLLCSHPLEDGHACGVCESCRLIDAGTHPDMHWLEPVVPETSTSKNPVTTIRTGMIQTLVDTLAATSQFGGYRCAVIANAEKMNREAANRLLKTLEEPGADTMILLVCSRPSRLPITIRSRCQIMRFALSPQPLAMQWLSSATGGALGEAALLSALRLTHGAPLHAKQFLDEWTGQHELLTKALLVAGDGPSLQYASELAQLPSSLTLIWLLDWISDIGRLLSCGPKAVIVNENHRDQLAARAEQADARLLYRLHDEVCELLRHDATALNPQLIWENLLISWDGI